ncbi:SDR family oxidoreductase [Rhodopseudomonas boonkerdii]|uniref:SDR family NAD(P)-dependent oxidoreductase n=1 Tax=Rhodopseudomonas boonkerdii TaxID=475937 RepID=UPI001E51ACB8|nr:SDR family NAD(P)-dependent oxidoreductase [Rhodopseudomonas boonkerdii]UGV26786.1 SDR family oxidoreductase [Rhodopseudomonas boonkerdii]
MNFAQRRFAGRTAIVTGAASGIGKEVARRLVAEGAKVAMWDVSDAIERAAAELDGAHIEKIDISSERDVEVGMKRSIAALGAKLDIVVSSAGITGPNTPLRDYPAEDWRRVFDINVNGTFFVNRAAVRAMEKNDYGRIVNIASIAGKEGNPNASAYSASKAAVIGLTKSLGKETAKSGIRVNCVTPAAIKTPLFDQMTQQHIDFMLSKIPQGRFGTLEEVASMVCWLTSEECSFSTGAVFDLSGGRATY